MADAMLQTEYAFTLPRGYADERGDLHRVGVMRLATALDEVAPLGDPRVQANPAYLGILLMSRVVTRLGDLRPVGERVIEGLFATDFAYLEELYLRLNENAATTAETQCPSCGARFEVDLGEADSDA